MICPECKTEKGCSCQFYKIEGRTYKVCSDCKKKIDNERNAGKEAPPPNVQGV